MSEKLPEASHAIEIVLVLIVQTPIKCCLRKHKVETCHASPSPKKLRGKCTFNFLQDCLFCGHGCRVSHPLKNPGRWRAIYLCRTTDDGKTTSKEAIYETNGACGREVAFRVI